MAQQSRTLSVKPMWFEPQLALRGTQLAGWEPRADGRTPASGILYDEDVAITLSDGTVLLADLFRPSGLGPVPVLVSWAVYIKETERLGGGPFIDESGVCPYVIKSGYAVLRVQPRGTGRSGGVAPEEICDPQERLDCHEAIEWAARQSWCDGTVGMTGMSYFAIAQLLVAATRPPSLKAILPHKGMTDTYRQGFYKGGAAYSGIIELFAAFEKTMPPRIPSGIRHVLSYFLNRERFSMEMSDPVKTERKVRKFLRAHPPPEAAVRGYIRRMFDRTFDDGDFWSRRSVSPVIGDIDIPVCIATDFGAQDLHLPGAFELWHRLQSRKFLFVGPPSYIFPWSTYQRELVAWYDWQLKGIDNGYADLPPVRYWLRGAERWQSATDWPIPEATPWRLLLAAGRGDPAAPQRLQTDPGEGTGAAGTCSYLAVPSTSFCPPEVDHIEKQVLHFATEPCERALTVVGPVTLTLDFTATAIDTYFVARIDDVAPDGRRTKLSWGWILASHRTIDAERTTASEIVHVHSAAAARQVVPEQRTVLRFSLNPLANQFAAGHRLELLIASRPELLASESGEGFDMFHWDPVPYRSRNSIHFDGAEPSRLELCVLPDAPIPTAVP